jgi:hypothetical protein
MRRSGWKPPCSGGRRWRTGMAGADGVGGEGPGQ